MFWGAHAVRDFPRDSLSASGMRSLLAPLLSGIPFHSGYFLALLRYPTGMLFTIFGLEFPGKSPYFQLHKGKFGIEWVAGKTGTQVNAYLSPLQFVFQKNWGTFLSCF